MSDRLHQVTLTRDEWWSLLAHQPMLPEEPSAEDWLLLNAFAALRAVVRPADSGLGARAQSIDLVPEHWEALAGVRLPRHEAAKGAFKKVRVARERHRAIEAEEEQWTHRWRWLKTFTAEIGEDVDLSKPDRSEIEELEARAREQIEG